MKYCGTCGIQVADNATSCPNCNSSFPTVGANTQNNSNGFVEPTWGGESQPQQNNGFVNQEPNDYLHQSVSANMNGHPDLNKVATPNLNKEASNGGFVTPDTSGTAENPYYMNNNNLVQGRANVLVNILGFLFPIVGIIFLAFVWTDQKQDLKYDSLVKCVAVRMIIDFVLSVIGGIVTAIIWSAALIYA